MINIRTKGAEGEREIVKMLNNVILRVGTAAGYTETELGQRQFLVQRNQNQSAVGGRDLINTHGYAVEVKRQETLSLQTWWKQAQASADGDIPVVIFRQSRRPWECLIPAIILCPIPHEQMIKSNFVGRFPIETFLVNFEYAVSNSLMAVSVE